MDMDKTAIGVLDADEHTQMMAPVSNATQMAMNVTCPVCRTANSPSETYCIDCGFLLSSAPLSIADMPETPSMGKLITTDGAREFPLNPGANTVGRENADVLLAHNTVSRKHATVIVEDGHAYVEDAGSTNGTYVAGTKITEKTELTDGCDVTFGSYTLKYQAPAKTETESVEEPNIEVSEKTEAITVESAENTSESQVDESEPGETIETAVEEEPGTKVAGRLVSKDDTLSYDINYGTLKIGRREGDNDIVIHDPYCSGRHADLLAEEDKFTLTDIGSTNGTFVNGIKMDINSPRELHAGDEVILGRTAFRLEVA